MTHLPTQSSKDTDRLPSILQVGDVLLSSDILMQRFCCDLEACKGICCIEGDAGAPVTLDEIGAIEAQLDNVWHTLSATAQAVIDRDGISYVDRDGDLVTSIVGGKDCVFTCHENGCCYCALEKAYRNGTADFCKPISCALYPIREKTFSNGMVGLNYHRWSVCRPAVELGHRIDLPLYRFLREPLVRRFGEAWYDELCQTAQQLSQIGH